MGGVSLFFDYFIWHYSRAFSYALVVLANFVWFVVHFFSIPLLVRTLFSPWRRMHEEYHKTGLEDFFATLVVNIMTRIVGFLVRFFVLSIGLSVLLIVVLSLAVWIVVWVLLPVGGIAAFIYGVTLLSL